MGHDDFDPDRSELFGIPIEGIPENIRELMSRMESMGLGMDPGSTVSRNIIKHTKEPLEALCEGILEEKDELRRISSTMAKTFKDPEFTESELEGSGLSMSLFTLLHENLARNLSVITNGYLSAASEYELHVQGRLDNLDRERQRYSHRDEEATAVEKARELLERTTKLFFDTKVQFPAIVEGFQKTLVGYSKYLQDRFQKPEDEKKQKTMGEMLRMHEEMKRPRGAYVKVKLVGENPILTDILLELTDQIPAYKKLRSGKKEVNHLSPYALEQSARKLAALSDGKLLEYIREPKMFFETMGTVLDKFNEVAQRLERYHKRILSMEHVAVIGGAPDEVRKALEANGKRTARDIQAVKLMDLDTIVQNQDDLAPNNKKETDYFRLRDKLFGVLYEGLQGLAKTSDPYDRVDEAKEIVLKAAELKNEMSGIMTSEKLRRLRRNRNEDNEYYEGRQGEIGMFSFERMPTPEVKIDDVIGKSFDRAKKHLQEIVETGTIPRVMRLSAPGGKVRSNLLLIGPYGCGKTELARAVCADPRVIGASVSVASTLTAYLHESVNNVKRVYDAAMELRREGRDQKPVVLVLDEFDGWFAGNGRESNYTETDMQQIETVLLQVLDGMGDYNGVITMAMTNNPRAIPPGILRRFRYVDVVGQLNHDERKQMLKMYLEKSLPTTPDVSDNYEEWANRLKDAPGDVVRKVVDEIHFEMLPKFRRERTAESDRVEKVLLRREIREGTLSDRDIGYVREVLQKHNYVVTASQVTKAMDSLLQQPPIQLQINAARELYDDAHELLTEISSPKSGFGFARKSKLFDVEK